MAIQFEIIVLARKTLPAASLADVAKLVDALDLGSSEATRGGSSPSIRTKIACFMLMGVRH